MKIFFLIFGLIGCTLGAVRAENWPQFRGPTGQGVVRRNQAAFELEQHFKRAVEDGHPERKLVVPGDLGRPRVRHHRDGRG